LEVSAVMEKSERVGLAKRLRFPSSLVSSAKMKKKAA